MDEQEEFEFRLRAEQEAKANQPARSRPLPANAGVANFAASVAGIPGDFLENVANLGIAAYGRAKGAVTGDGGAAPEPLAPGALGGTEFMRNQLRRLAGATGMEGFSPDNPNPSSPMDTTQYNFVSRGGFIPGGGLPAAGSLVAEGIGGPQWAGVGALAPTAAIRAYNDLRAPRLAQAQAENASRDKVLKGAREEGLVVPPSEAGAGIVSNTVESIAGKAATRQGASAINSPILNKMAARSLGIPENIPLTEQLIQKVRADAGLAYQRIKDFGSGVGLKFRPDADYQSEIASIGGQYSKAAKEFPELLKNDEVQALKDALQNAPMSPAAAVELTKSLRAQASVNYKAFNDQSKLALADAQRSAATAIEGLIERNLGRSGAGQLVTDFKAARTQIARSYDVEAALEGTNIDARVLKRISDKGRPLGGGLEKIAEFATQFPNSTQLPQKAGSPDVRNLASLFSMGGGALGSLAGGAIGAGIGAAIPFVAPPVARAGLLSGVNQNRVANPSYSPALVPESNLEALIRQGLIANGQR